MINPALKEKQPFVSNFFENALSNNSQKFAHAYMLTGSDSIAQYNLAISLSKILNCKNKGDYQNCSCTNCQWINQNRHPAVITLSPVDCTYANEKSKRMSVISRNQGTYLKKELANTSNYHRVIIFTDAVDNEKYQKEYEYLWKNYSNLSFPIPTHTLEESERTCWIPKPLSRRTFQSEVANSLLKTIEEPNENITFFFLVKDKEEMLDTIVSRCQIIPVLNNEINKPNLMEPEKLLMLKSKFPVATYTSALVLSEYITELIKEYSITDILDAIQTHFLSLLKMNMYEIKTYEHFIMNVETAKTQLKFNVNPTSVIESLCYKFVEK